MIIGIVILSSLLILTYLNIINPAILENNETIENKTIDNITEINITLITNETSYNITENLTQPIPSNNQKETS